jgi:hypothetical protein
MLTMSANLALDCAASADCPTVCISVDSFLSTPVILSSTADILASVLANLLSTPVPRALIASLVALTKIRDTLSQSIAQSLNARCKLSTQPLSSSVLLKRSA